MGEKAKTDKIQVGGAGEIDLSKIDSKLLDRMANELGGGAEVRKYVREIHSAMICLHAHVCTCPAAMEWRKKNPGR